MGNKTISGKAPLRISFAGGGTDLNYIFEKYDGAVVNSTIDKYCHMRITLRDDKQIFVNEVKLNPTEILAYKVIEYYKPEYGFELTYYNDIEPGSGLGSSSSFVILLLRLLNELDNKPIIDSELVKDAYNIETQIKEGGWQDQYACSLGGFNFIEFYKNNTLVYPLRLKYSYICKLNEHFVLVEVNGKKNDIHKKLREYSEKNIDELKRTSQIKDLAYKMRDCLLKSSTKGIDSILRTNWYLKRNKFTTNKQIDKLYELGLMNGATGGKICGSGQCGHFLFYVEPEHKPMLLKALKVKKYKIVDFNFGIHGVETWKD